VVALSGVVIVWSGVMPMLASCGAELLSISTMNSNQSVSAAVVAAPEISNDST